MNTLPARSRALLGAGLLLLGAGAAAGESLQGALEASVNRLDLTLVGTVILEVGNEAGYRVTADEAEALEALRIETRGRRLIVEQETPKRSGWIWDKGERLPVTLTVTLPAFETVAFSGAGRLTGRGLSGDELSLRLAGAGECELGDLSLGHFGLALAGAARCDVSGRADALEVSIAGAGSFEGFDLETQAAQVSVAGAGSAEVTARESFEGSVAGIGHIAYRGNPGSVEQSVSGLGRIEAD